MNSYFNIRYIFTALAVIVSLTINAQLDASFSVSATDGCSPLLVNFTSSSADNSGNTYYWDFGNGNTSTLKNPISTYTEPGVYSVSLTIRNGNDEEKITKTDLIEIHTLPEISFTPEVSINECAPYSVPFECTVSDDNQYSYIWDFGDGIQSSQKNPTHTFENSGTFNVSVMVVDEYGCFTQLVHEELIKINKPKASFTIDEDESCKGELTANFTNNSTGVGELTYLWDFGNSNTSSDEHPSNNYYTEGTYNLSLTVTDNIGCSTKLKRDNAVSITNTIANFSLPKDTICINELIQVESTSVNGRRLYWYNNGVESSNETNPSFQFSDYGNHNIKLVISNKECTDSISKTVHVEEVVADFINSKPYSCEVPTTINFTSASKNAETYEWTFGDETTYDSQNVTHTYINTTELAKTGIAQYTERLTVTSKHGCKSTIEKTNSTTIKIPQIKIQGSGFSGCSPIQGNYSVIDDYSNELDKIETYTWKYDDKTVSNTSSWSQEFIEPQNASLTLEVTTEMGCASSNSKQISVGTNLNADFEVQDKNTFCASEEVYFVDTTPRDMISYNVDWQFGDGESSFMGIPMHSYQDTGYFDVTIEVNYNGCLSTKTKTDAVNIKGPVVGFSRVNACNKSNDVEFSAEIKGATEYTWDFGDNSSTISNKQEPIHTYSTSGKYVVKLTGTNSETGCSYTRQRNIYLTNLKAELDPISEAPCLNSTIRFDATNSVDAFGETDKKYTFDFGDGSDIIQSDTVVFHKYNKPDNYVSTLTIKDRNNCEEQAITPITIYHPTPKFTSNYTKGCIPVEFQFNNLTESEAAIQSWLWEFGDNSTSTEQQPLHEYHDFGKYDVSLTVTDEHSCSASIKINDAISVIKPNVAFKVNDSTTCVNTEIEFSDVSESNIDVYEWKFGDGEKSTSSTPVYSYNKSGYYDIALKIIDDHGCVKEDTIKDFIHIQDAPKPEFDANSTISDCYPFQVEFTDLTNADDIDAWYWDFGDGEMTSTVQLPKHMYNKPGSYDVSLIGSSSYGCSDTITKSNFITIRGPYAEIVVKDTSCIYDMVSFSLQNKKNISSILWDLGDGTLSRSETITHKYNRKGFIYPNLIIETTSDLNCRKMINDTIYIDELKSEIKFVDNIGAGCEPYEVAYIDNSTKAKYALWTFPDQSVSFLSNPTNTVNTHGTYTTELISTSQSGCKDTSSIDLTVFPLPKIEIIKDTFICLNSNIMLWADGGIKYNWGTNPSIDEQYISNPIASPTKTTVYNLELSDQNNCTSYDSVQVTVQQYPYVDMPDSTIIIGETITLDISNDAVKSYNWDADNTISCYDCSTPIFSPKENKQYIVTLTDTADCFNVDQAYNINVEQKYSLDVAKAFTPNNDGVNDILLIKGWGIKEVLYFKIFNTWGELIYNSENINEGWDGTYKGTAQPIGTFSYSVGIISFDNKKRTKKGIVQLIR